MIKKLNYYAGQLYLELLVSKNYPEQEPKYKLAKWYDLFWFLIPIIGVLFFLEKIKNRT